MMDLESDSCQWLGVHRWKKKWFYERKGHELSSLQRSGDADSV